MADRTFGRQVIWTTGNLADRTFGRQDIWTTRHLADRTFDKTFLSDEGPMLETLDRTIRIGSTPTVLYFDLYLHSAYAAHYVYRHLDDRTFGQQDIWPTGHLDDKTFGRQDIWTTRHLDDRTFGRQDIWTTRHLDDKTFGRQDI